MNPRDRDNAGDRKIGEHWERQFGQMAAGYGLTFTPHQIGRPSQSAAAYTRGDEGWSTLLLPDVTIWSAPGEHHEIKHKNRTHDGMYGLERYRLDALVRFANTTGQRVQYTIHDWELAGAGSAAEIVTNDITHWHTGDVARLSLGYTTSREDWTYFAGGQRRVEVWYWTFRPLYFQPLADLWVPKEAEADAARWSPGKVA